jgi:hypothetical protein
MSEGRFEILADNIDVSGLAQANVDDVGDGIRSESSDGGSFTGGRGSHSLNEDLRDHLTYKLEEDGPFSGLAISTRRSLGDKEIDEEQANTLTEIVEAGIALLAFGPQLMKETTEKEARRKYKQLLRVAEEGEADMYDEDLDKFAAKIATLWIKGAADLEYDRSSQGHETTVDLSTRQNDAVELVERTNKLTSRVFERRAEEVKAAAAAKSGERGNQVSSQRQSYIVVVKDESSAAEMKFKQLKLVFQDILKRNTAGVAVIMILRVCEIMEGTEQGNETMLQALREVRAEDVDKIRILFETSYGSSNAMDKLIKTKLADVPQMQATVDVHGMLYGVVVDVQKGGSTPITQFVANIWNVVPTKKVSYDAAFKVVKIEILLFSYIHNSKTWWQLIERVTQCAGSVLRTTILENKLEIQQIFDVKLARGQNEVVDVSTKRGLETFGEIRTAIRDKISNNYRLNVSKLENGKISEEIQDTINCSRCNNNGYCDCEVSSDSSATNKNIVKTGGGESLVQEKDFKDLKENENLGEYLLRMTSKYNKFAADEMVAYTLNILGTKYKDSPTASQGRKEITEDMTITENGTESTVGTNYKLGNFKVDIETVVNPKVYKLRARSPDYKDFPAMIRAWKYEAGSSWKKRCDSREVKYCTYCGFSTTKTEGHTDVSCFELMKINSLDSSGTWKFKTKFVKK